MLTFAHMQQYTDGIILFSNEDVLHMLNSNFFSSRSLCGGMIILNGAMHYNREESSSSGR
jgi:hypothetical protein